MKTRKLRVVATEPKPKAVRPGQKWKDFALKQDETRDEWLEAMKKEGIIPTNQPPNAGWDWLGWAVHKLGGPGKAAAAIGISRQTLYTYLEEGLGGAQYRTVKQIAALTRLPIEFLREGPPDPEHM